MKKRFFFGFTTLLLVVMFILGGCKSTDNSLIDTYTHASRGNALTQPGVANKVILEGQALSGALRYLEDVSHYLYTWKDLPAFKAAKYPNGFDEDWRSSVNGRVYRGPYYDPLTRSICWLTVNPNGSVNTSLGSYWGVVGPNKQLPAVEAYGYIPSNNYQAFSYMSSGESVQNWIERKRGTMAIDGSLAQYYGLTGAQQLFIEVKLNHYVPRSVTPEEFYNGLIPESWSMGVNGEWSGYATDNGKPYYDFAGYWALTEEQQTAYCAQAAADPAVMEILTDTGGYFWFDIMQIVKVGDLIGFEYESSQGKINGIDQDHDGYLDKYSDYQAGGKFASKNITVQIPDGKTASDYIISYNSQNVVGPNANQLRMPTAAFTYNWNDGWWWDWFSPGPLIPRKADGSVYP